MSWRNWVTAIDASSARTLRSKALEKFFGEREAAAERAYHACLWGTADGIIRPVDARRRRHYRFSRSS
jgi:hypothetical protein